MRTVALSQLLSAVSTARALPPFLSLGNRSLPVCSTDICAPLHVHAVEFRPTDRGNFPVRDVCVLQHLIIQEHCI